MTTVLLAGATGMLGERIARHLLDHDDVTLRLLLRSDHPTDPAKGKTISDFVARGADIAIGDLSHPATLATATKAVDVIVSAVQGGADVIIDGQLALATAGNLNGVRRFLPSDYALDIFAAPPGAPTLDLRREVAGQLRDIGPEILHVLNGGFLDMMLAHGAGMIDLDAPTAAYFGTGDEPFDLTTVDDTAHFTAELAVDDAATGGVYKISGSRTSINAIADGIEQRTGQTVPRTSHGTIEQLRRQLEEAGDPWNHVMEWYSLALFTTPPFDPTDNSRYPDLKPTTLDEYLDRELSLGRPL